jgi:hypothetical protein
MGTADTNCGHDAGNCVNLVCLFDGDSFCGGSHRRDKIGGFANGMARNWRVFGNSGSTSPVKVPVAVRTVSGSGLESLASDRIVKRNKIVSFMLAVVPGVHQS